MAQILRAVVTANHHRLAAPFDDLVECMNRPGCQQREIDLDAQTLAVEIVEHIEEPEIAAIAELVVDEVHRPGLVNRLGHGQSLRLLAYDPMLGLDAQIQFQLAVDAIFALVIPAKALDVAQVQ